VKEYLQLLQRVRDTGVKKEDRTKTGTYSCFGAQLRFDLSKGFPAVTTKRLHFAGVVSELLWFLRGETDLRYLHANNNHIWDEWADPVNNLPNIYGKQWRRWESFGDEVVLVKKREEINEVLSTPNELTSVKTDADDFVGKEFKNSEGDFFVVKERVTTSPNSVYIVQFKHTLGVTKASRPNIKTGAVKDPRKPSVCSVGYVGNGEIRPKTNRKLYNLWRSMLARCYKPSHPSYPLYGGKGVTISKSWKDFNYFSRSVTQVPFYKYWEKHPEEYSLDKDYFGALHYSEKTTIFLKNGENTGLSSTDGSAFRVDGKLFVANHELARYLGVHSQRVSDWVLGLAVGRKTPIAFKEVELLTPPSGYLYRKRRVTDQLQTIIRQIKDNPSSRRLAVNSWNINDLDDMALPPCHLYYQFYVSEGKLSLFFHMRSSDIFLGLPYNIASYALLTHLIARECNLEVGELVYSGTDVHLYNNHLQQAALQLSRSPKTLPTLWLNPELTTVDSFTLSDIKLLNYEHCPAIKAPIAV